MNGIVGGAHPAQLGISQQAAQQHLGGQQTPQPQPGGPPRPPNTQPPGPAHLGSQRPLGIVNGVGVAMAPGVGPRPVAGPGRPGPGPPVAMTPTMLVRSGILQQQQQTGGPAPPPSASGQQQHPHPPQTPQIGQAPASPQKDTWTNLFFEFAGLSPADQSTIMTAAGFPDRQPNSLANEADKVR